MFVCYYRLFLIGGVTNPYTKHEKKSLKGYLIGLIYTLRGNLASKKVKNKIDPNGIRLVLDETEPRQVMERSTIDS